MKLYAVFAEGVYRHECGGIYSTLESACEVADAMAQGSDGHHDYCVYEYELNNCPPWKPMERWGSGMEREKPVREFKVPYRSKA